MTRLKLTRKAVCRERARERAATCTRVIDRPTENWGTAKSPIRTEGAEKEAKLERTLASESESVRGMKEESAKIGREEESKGESTAA